jgi:hypothetical protein
MSANARFATLRANLCPVDGRSTTTRTPAPPSWAKSAFQLLAVRGQAAVPVDNKKIDSSGRLGQQT